MAEVIAEARKLSKQYKDTKALDDINFKLKRGNIYGLVGKNGAGKTTLLRILTGQAFQTEGNIALFGESSYEGLSKGRKRIGAIIEEPGFYSDMTAEQNLEYYRIQRGIPGKRCVQEALKEVSLLDTGNKKFSQFSLGMKQRLGLALALMNKPEILLLDEPINGLDPFGIVEIRNLLLKLNQEKKITMLISSHILSELSNLVTFYGFLDQGKLIKQLSEEELSAECSKYLEVKVDKAERLAALLEIKLGCHAYKVTSDYSIHIYEYLNQPEIVSQMAVQNGIGLSSIGLKEMSLENYFMQLVGGNVDETIYEK
ncbi:ABC transporter ATP-binding protein [Anaerocolumna xylanovorans]|uniref:ABC-2 type transport system ATP-binding protein n=1 Tax=Anaerocolumna xylanovorans DSM 12503 TaxID=1121345 RepID=A0A1M7YN33_9FIRM|nr:ABC transporter ATP-binding protein [Anaerocolumna xylanovorans]SHO54002.1 ABC-2 type transport system ATP-binding protein [Anaerocolumna xylanovorans DSM 12503]